MKINKGESELEENKILFADFVKEDRFELNSYLNYLFTEVLNHFPKSLDDKMEVH